MPLFSTDALPEGGIRVLRAALLPTLAVRVAVPTHRQLLPSFGNRGRARDPAAATVRGAERLVAEGHESRPAVALLEAVAEAADCLSTTTPQLVPGSSDASNLAVTELDERSTPRPTGEPRADGGTRT